MAREVRRSAARYRALVEASALAVWRTDGAGRLISDMPGWRDLTGQSVDDLTGDGWLRSIPEPDRARVSSTWRRAVETGTPYEAEYPIVTADGATRRIHARGLPVSEDGRIREWIGTATDITERHEALAALQEEEQAVETLREVGITLSAELELSRVVSELTEATTKLTSAQFGAFFYTASTKGGEEFLLHSLSGMSQEEFGHFPAPRNTAIFAPTFAGDPPVRLDDVTADPRFGRNPPFNGMPEGHLPVRSYLAVPVVSRTGRVHGGLFFGHAEPGRFTERHERLVVGVAAQAAIALDNAFLFDAERTARAEAEAAQHQLGLLAAASHRMAVSLDVEETARVLADTCVAELADFAVVFLVGPSRQVEPAALVHVDPERREQLRDLLERYPVRSDAPYGAGAAIRTGEASFQPSIDEEHRRQFAVDDAHHEELDRHRATSVIAVPLEARGRIIGALSVRREGGASFDEDDLRVVEELARRGAVAIDNVLLYERERTAALMLQRSLLPRILPALDGAVCAVRYLPGAAGAEVGGDWYDVLALENGQIAVAVGDVQGRGLTAASVMGQLRAAVRAYALEGHVPREVIARADRVLASLDDAPLATCVYARYDPASHELTVANAGHLPPLVIDGRGARFLELAPGLPLGVGGAAFEQTTIVLEEGARLLLFTDGLVEGPTVPLDEGLARLAAAVSEEGATVDLGVEEIADLVLARLVSQDTCDDDVALLVLGVGSRVSDRTVELADDPRAVRTARRLAQEMCRATGDEDLCAAVGLLVSEVVTNAVRHSGTAARMRVRVAGRRVRVEVFDNGANVAEPRASIASEPLPDRGRGLHLVASLTQSWGVEPTGGGKCVWFEVTAGSARSFAVLAPTEDSDGTPT